MQVCLVPVWPIHCRTAIPYPRVVHSAGEPRSRVFEPHTRMAQAGVGYNAAVPYSCFPQVCFFCSAILRTPVLQGGCPPQVCFRHVLAPDLFCGVAPMQVGPSQVFFFIRDPMWVAPPNRSAWYHRVSRPRVSPHLGDLTDAPALHAGVSSSSFALPLPSLPPAFFIAFPHYRIGFPLQVHARRGPTSRLAPPPHLCSGAQAGSALPSQVSD